MATESSSRTSIHLASDSLETRQFIGEAGPVEKGSRNDIQNSATQLKGWRLYVVLAAVSLGIFLVQLEITIVSTSLVSITNDLLGLRDVSWVVTAYLITYSGCLTILSKLSDTFGRRPVITTSFIIFIASSVGCGFAQSIPTLIVLRAFQGIGGGGIFALAFVILPEIVSPQRYAAYAAMVGGVAAVASLLGPLLGGAISNTSSSSWRWIFWLNGPAGFVALCLILAGLPKNFPFHASGLPSQAQSTQQKLQTIDYAGAVLLLGACVLLIVSLEEGATQSSWTSALPPMTLVVSVVLWISFIMWSRYLYRSRSHTKIEAIFPWPLMLNRFAMGALMCTFFSGSILFALAISLPQRFQLIYGSNSFLSGVYILPLTIASPLGTILTGVLLTRFRIPPLFLLFGSAVMELVGLAILGGQTVRNGIPATVYGLQVLIGLGLGVNLTTSILVMPMVASKEHQAIGMGSLGQFRNLGGSIVLAIFANVLNSSVSSRLSTLLSPDQLSMVTQHPESITLLPGLVQSQVKDAYEDAFQLQLRVLLAWSCCLFLAVGLLFEKHPRRQDGNGELN